MKERSYIISGIKPNIAEVWYEEFKGITKFYKNKKTGNYAMKLKFTMIDAIKAKISLIKYNFKHGCKLKIRKYKGKHFRV